MLTTIKEIRQMARFYERFHNPKMDRLYADAMRMDVERAAAERRIRLFNMPELPLHRRLAEPRQGRRP